MGLREPITSLMALPGRLWRWYAPPVPRGIRDPLHLAQIENVRAQAPMLLMLAAINVCIIIAVCWHERLPLKNYGWMVGLVGYCGIRLRIWHRIVQQPAGLENSDRIIKTNIAVALAMMIAISAFTAITYALGTFDREILIPVSVTFGAMAIAHCFYALRPASIGVLLGGITPVAASLMLFGNFNAQMTGWSMLSVEVLMIRFVAAQYDALISGLFLEQQIRELADSDPLTGLPNRRVIMAAIEKEIERHGETGRGFGVALLDLDGFKEVNDTLGHHAGDLMLLGVGARLVKDALPDDTVARLGGDEFVILFRNVTDKPDLSARTTALLAGLCRPIEVDGKRLPVAASLGYALFPDDGGSVREVMHAADLALYAEKRSGKAQQQTRAGVLRSA